MIKPHVYALRLKLLEIVAKASDRQSLTRRLKLTLSLGVDGRHADQQVRGAIVLPHGTGKTVRVLVFAKGDTCQGGGGGRC